MKKAVNYVRGSICVEVECPYPERFVNVCAQNGIEFWRLNRLSATVVTVHVHIGGYRLLKSLAARAGFAITPVKKTGVPFFLWKIRKRYVLLIGMALCLLTVHSMSLFIWEIQVVGNEKIPASLILETLGELGVGTGSFGPSITTEAVSNEMILRLPKLSWIAVNVSGSRAHVLVRERIPKPEIIDEKTPAMVYALKPGVIVKMNVLEGAKVYAAGDTVEADEVIVTGIMDSLASGRRAVHAMAEVYARTWYEKSAKMPLEAVIKEYTGKSETRKALVIGCKKINLFLNGRIPWASYDKITDESAVRFLTGNTLPLSVVTEEYAEYIPLRSALSVSDAEKILRDSLLGTLREEIGGGSIVGTEFGTDVAGGVVTVTLRAECIEEIAASRGFSDVELLGVGAAS